MMVNEYENHVYAMFEILLDTLASFSCDDEMV